MGWHSVSANFHYMGRTRPDKVRWLLGDPGRRPWSPTKSCRARLVEFGHYQSSGRDDILALRVMQGWLQGSGPPSQSVLIKSDRKLLRPPPPRLQWFVDESRWKKYVDPRRMCMQLCWPLESTLLVFTLDKNSWLRPCPPTCMKTGACPCNDGPLDKSPSMGRLGRGTVNPGRRLHSSLLP